MLLRSSVLWRLPNTSITKDFYGRTKEVEQSNQLLQRRHMGILEKIQEFINKDPALKQGALWEMKSLKSQKDGKFYEMPNPAKLFSRDKATPFPEPKGTLKNLEGENVQLSKILQENRLNFIIASKKRVLAANMINTWLNEISQSIPNLNPLELVIVDDPVWKSFKWFVERGEMEQIKPARYKRVLHYYPSILSIYSFDSIDSGDTTVQTVLEIQNSYVPYCFLVYDGLIRWKAVGEPTRSEMKGLTSITSKIMEQTNNP